MLDESVFHNGRLAVVGNINRDLKTAPIESGPHLFTDGETSIAGIRETIGGGGANSAAIAGRLAGSCVFLGHLGTDDTARRLEAALQRAGVRCVLYRDPKVPTGTTLNLVFRSGHRHFLSCLPNNEALSVESLDLEALRGCDHLYRADVWFSESMLYGGNEKLFQAARSMGLAVSLDLNWDPHWNQSSASEVQRRKRALGAVMPLVDLVHGNERELCSYTETSSLSAALTVLRKQGAGAVVFHGGNKGAGYYDEHTAVLEPPAPVKTIVNATGSGDVLSVCWMLLHQRKDIDHREKLRLANRVVGEFMSGQRDLIPEL